jgi:hypothetical protein
LLSLSLTPPFLQRWSLDGILKARELFLFVQLTFACCCYCWTCDRKLVFDINPHQCWELSEDVMVGCQFHIDFPFKVSDHVLLLLVEGLWTCVAVACGRSLNMCWDCCWRSLNMCCYCLNHLSVFGFVFLFSLFFRILFFPYFLIMLLLLSSDLKAL